MGILDNLLNAATSGGANPTGAIGAILQQQGGVGGLIQAFESQGLGGLAKSWVSNGENLPVGADQIQAVLGSGPVAAVASRLGVDQQEAAGHIASLLPQLVDHLTPNGELPAGGGLGALSGLLNQFRT